MEWAKCNPPMKKYGVRFRRTIFKGEFDECAAEALMKFESTGEEPPTEVNRSACYQVLRNGKAMRDEWHEERKAIKKSAFIDEEFIDRLDPICFIEFFGRAPRTHMVRYLFDNYYPNRPPWHELFRRWVGLKPKWHECFHDDAEILFQSGLEREQGGWRVVREL